VVRPPEPGLHARAAHTPAHPHAHPRGPPMVLQPCEGGGVRALRGSGAPGRVGPRFARQPTVHPGREWGGMEGSVIPPPAPQRCSAACTAAPCLHPPRSPPIPNPPGFENPAACIILQSPKAILRGPFRLNNGANTAVILALEVVQTSLAARKDASLPLRTLTLPLPLPTTLSRPRRPRWTSSPTCR